MNAAKPLVFGLLVLVVATSLLMPHGTRPSKSLVLRNVLKADEATLDFGQKWAHEPFEWIVKIQNQSSADLSIERVEASCSCTSILQKSFAIPAGEAFLLPFRITPAPEQAALSGDCLSNIAIFVRGRPNPERLQIRGSVRRRLTLEPDELFFGSMFQEECTKVARECVLRSTLPLSEVSPFESDGNAFNIRVTPESPTQDV